MAENQNQAASNVPTAPAAIVPQVRPMVKAGPIIAAQRRAASGATAVTVRRLRTSVTTKPDIIPNALARKATPSVSSIFPLGFYYQPKSSFATWAGRGCNFAYGWEPESNSDGSPGVPLSDYVKAAEAMGLGTVRDPSDGLNDANWWGIVLPDEPDAGDVAAAIPGLKAKIASYRASSPGVPIILNLSGGRLLGLQSGPASYDPFWQLDVDAFGSDLYPVTGWGQRSPDWLKKVGDCVRFIKAKAPGKKVLSFIESSDQRLPWVPAGMIATPAEVRAMIWHAIIAGADMLCVFADIIGTGWLGFDGTPPANALEIARQFANIQYLGNVLNSPKAEINAPAPFLSATRTLSDGTVFTFTLNNSNAAAVHPNTGVHFEPYGVRYARSDEGTIIIQPGPGNGGGDLTKQAAAIAASADTMTAAAYKIASLQFLIAPKQM